MGELGGKSHRKRVISLGAGVQSTALTLMALDGRWGDPPPLAVFADTGWEPKAVYAHLEWLRGVIGDRMEVAVISGGNIRDDAIAAASGDGGRFASMPLHVRNLNGEKGQLRRQCTKEYKIAVVRRELRRRGYDAAELWMGISLDEWQRMKDADVQWVSNRWPLIEHRLTREDCKAWLADRGYPEPPKSACIGCPYMDNARWRDLRENRPDEWEDACEVDEALRHLPRIRGEAFLHPQLVPLREVVLDLSDTGQLDFDAECEGMCGV